jgi:hypothetical protein
MNIYITKPHYWNEDEIAILKELWPNSYDSSDLIEILNLPRTVIDRKAYTLKICKTDHIKSIQTQERSKLVTYRNKNILGRNQTLEFAREQAVKYNSLQEFKKNDLSTYTTASRNGYLEDITSHMIIGNKFSYPQMFLFFVMRKMFPDNIIRYNDRKFIYPYELDVFIPELKMAFEYDGIIYHTTEDAVNNDKFKDNLCVNKGITLYRIKEKNKLMPEYVIIEELKRFGFPVSGIDIQEIINLVYTKRYSHNSILEEISKYTTTKDFLDHNPSLYSFLKRKNLFDKYCSSLIPTRFKIEESDVIEKILLCKNKSQMVKDYHRFYIKMMKNKWSAAYKIYSTLHGKYIKPKWYND